MEKKNRRRSSYRIGLGGIILRAALVLFVLILLSVHLMGGLFAKYSSSGKGGDDARVAKFQVNVTGEQDAISIRCGENDNGSYTITIENESEVAVHYDLSLTLNGETDGVTWAFSPASGDLAVGASGSSVLTFAVDWAAFTENATGDSVQRELTFAVTVNVTQID